MRRKTRWRQVIRLYLFSDTADIERAVLMNRGGLVHTDQQASSPVPPPVTFRHIDIAVHTRGNRTALSEACCYFTEKTVADVPISRSGKGLNFYFIFFFLGGGNVIICNFHF
jgi:hypothetical protein